MVPITCTRDFKLSRRPLPDAAKASVNFASVRQLEDVVAKATKSTPNDAPTVSQFNALVDTVDAVRNAQAELLPKSDLADV